MSKFYWFFSSLLILICSCNSEIHEPSADTILKHILEISDDKYQGRMPCTEGEDLCVSYLTKQLKEMGLKPGFGKSYTQDVPLLTIESFMSDRMDISTPKGPLHWKKLNDFVIHTQRKTDSINLNKSELVFCGFGIVDEKLGWNDYEGIDMKGKTAVVLVNDPGYGGEDENYFKGNEMTYFGRWTYKYEEADRQGADGLLIIHESNSAGYPWFVVRSSWTGPQQGITGIDRSNDCGVKGWITLDKARELIESSGHDFTTLVKSARSNNFKPVPLNSSISVSLTTEYSECKSKNIMGIIEGANKPEEHIIYTAHWDHIGIGTPVNGDSIYNGAEDNATGTACLLSMAEAFTASNKNNSRSLAFLFVTAEEQGLLGSEYYVLNPSIPLNQTVCNLNMDGMTTAGPMKDFSIKGLGHSEMDEYAQRAAVGQGRYIKAEPNPEKGYFYRSDHFNFAKMGVPALYGEGMYEHIEKGTEFVKEYLKTYDNERYHSPLDVYDENIWDINGVQADALIYFNVGAELANSKDWPKWYPKSEFKRPKTNLKD